MDDRFKIPLLPQQPPHLKMIYPWEDTNLISVCKRLYDTAINTGYTGTFEEFKEHFGEYLESGVSVIDVDEYTGNYEVSPLPTVDQILRTAGKVLSHDIVIKPIPYHEVDNASGGRTVTIG